MLGHQGVFVDEDRILGLDPGDAGAGPRHVDRAHARDAFARLLPTGDERLALFGKPALPLRHGGAAHPPVETGGEFRQRRCSGAGHREIARKTADRIARKQWIDAEMNDSAFGPRRLEARYPRDIAFENDDRVGAVEIWSRIIAEMAGMIGGDAEVTRTVLHDRDREAPRKIGERVDRRRVASGAGRDDQRVLGRAENAGSLLDGALVGPRRGGGNAARRTIVGKAPQRRRQDFARQGQIDRPAGRGSRDGKGAVDHRLELLAVAQFIVPFDDLAQHAGLIEHFLRPVDVDVAGSRKPALGQRRAAGGEQDGYIVARRIERAADAVRSADADMHHDRRDPARHHRVAMPHREGEVLVRCEHRLRHRHAGPRRLRERLDERREIGPRIGEQIFDPAFGKQREIGLGHIVDREFFARHESLRRRF